MNPTSETRAETGKITLRYDVIPGDLVRVREIVQSTGFFNDEEVGLAVELVDEHLRRGPASGYDFVFAEIDGRTVGYACYGRIPGTESSFDLYWIVVESTWQRGGIGRALLVEVEGLIRSRGGSRIYVDTSSRPQYAATRAFYERCGYRCEAVLREFFTPADDKDIYVKVVERPS